MDTIREQFERDGFYLAKGVFSRDETRELEAEFDRIVAQLAASGEDLNARWSGPEVDRLSDSSTVVLHTHNVQQYSAVWLRALLHERFLAVVREILGNDIVLHHTKLFQKPAEKGAPFPMHQDWAYFPTAKDTMMAGIIHVSDATDEMGCLRVYPGSHQKGRMDESDGQHQSEFLRRFPIEGSTPLPASGGDVLFFDYRLVHGSLPNRSDRVRKTVLVQLHSGDDRVEPGVSHPNERLVLSGWNYAATRSSANSGKG